MTASTQAPNSVSLMLRWADRTEYLGFPDVRSARAGLLDVMKDLGLALRWGNGFEGHLIDSAYLPEPTTVAYYEISQDGDR